MLPGYQLSHTGNLKCSSLDHFTQSFKILSANLLKGCFYNTRAADANIDDTVCFCYSVESTCHERIVIRSIAEYHQFRAAKGILLLACLRCFQHDLAHKLYCVHVDSCFCGTYVYRTAHTLCLCQSLRD